LYLVDPWSTKEYNKEKLNKVKSKFEKKIEKGKISVIRKRSEQALKEFENNSLDWVYIDTTHSYKQTKRELRISELKVKDGGVIAGHDYCNGVVYERAQFGVVPAVHEFCVTSGWEMRYLTLETSGFRSFALKKL